MSASTKITCVHSPVSAVIRTGRSLAFGCALALALALASSLSAQEGSAAWKYESRTDGFSIWLPGQPHVQSKLDPFTGAKMTMYGCFDLNGSYLIGVMPLPAAVPPGDEQAMFRVTISGFITGIKGTSVSQKATYLNGYPGREFTAKWALGTVEGRVYLIKGKLYILAAMPNPNAGANTNSQRFFYSFTPSVSIPVYAPNSVRIRVVGA